MPFTATKTVLFFKDQAYMALMRRTATALAAEGIAIPNNLSEFDKVGMDSIYCNLRKPAKVLRVGGAHVCVNSASSRGVCWATQVYQDSPCAPPT